MNKMTLFIGLVVCTLCICFSSVEAQIKEAIAPYTMTHSQLKNDIPTIQLKALDKQAIQAEDAISDLENRALRIAYPTEVNISSEKDGLWTNLPDGGKLWQLRIQASEAQGTILEYEHFWLPKGATLHLSNQDQSHLIGAFTNRNNKGSRNVDDSFLTELVKGDEVQLEYYEPADVEESGLIVIGRVMQAYRDVDHIKSYKGFGDAGNCQFNINCAAGNPYQTSKLAVARMLITPAGQGSFWCTGQMLNTTQGTFNPIFLTADHCMQGNSSNVHNATGNNNINCIFYWDYEAAGCANPGTEPGSITTSGAVLMANKSDSDFALFWLLEDPFRDAGFVPLYLGWDAGTPSAGGGCIHHPRGDIKKISLFTQTPTSNHSCAPNLTWSVIFNHGGGTFSSTEGGSSGSALFDDEQRVIGQLWGGSRASNCGAGPTCADPDDDLSYYGKFGDSWGDAGGKRQRLSDWLAQPCTASSSHTVNVTNTVETFIANGNVSSSAGIYDNSSIKRTVVELSGGSSVDFNNGFEIDGNAQLIVRNDGNCPSALQNETDYTKSNNTPYLDESRPELSIETSVDKTDNLTRTNQ